MIGESQVEEGYPLEEPTGRRKALAIKEVGKALVIWNLLHVRNEDERSDPQSLVSSYCKKKGKRLELGRPIYVTSGLQIGLCDRGQMDT